MREGGTGIALELAKAYVQIIPSADGINEKITEALGGASREAGKNAGETLGGKMISTLKAVIAAAGIGKALSAAITNGAALEQSLGGIETLFKGSADAVIANAQRAYATAGLSANAYMENVTSFSASLLQGLGGDTEKAAAIADMAMVDMSDNANKFGTDMRNIQDAYQGFAKQNYTMLDNLKLGYGGTRTEMERLLADAQKISGVKYDIGNLADVYSAIHVIQQELDIAGTTAKEASTTLSGSLASMKAAFSNVLGGLALGQDISPALQGLFDSVFTFLTGNLLPMVSNVLKGLPAALSGALDAAVRLIGTLGNDAGGVVSMGITIVEELVTGILAAAPYLVEAGLRTAISFGRELLNTDWAQVAETMISALRDNVAAAAGEILGTDGSIVDGILPERFCKSDNPDGCRFVHPIVVSTLPILMARRPHCLRRLTACKAASTLGL